MPFDQVGVEAVIKGLGPYLAGAQRIDAANASMGASVERTAQRSGVLSRGFGILQRNVLATAASFGAITTAIVATVTAADRFETALTRTIGLTRVTATEMKGVRQRLLDLAPALGKTPQELAEAFYFAASSVDDTEKALAATEVSAKAAAAGLGETASVVDAVTSVINAYGLSAEQAERVTDTLVATVRAGKGEPADLASSIGKVIPVASQMGVSFEEVGASMATMTRIGLNAEESATALRGVMVQLLSPTKQAEEALAGYGTSAAELREQIRERGLLVVLLELVRMLEGNDEALSTIIPDVRALVGVLATAGTQGEAYTQILAEIEGATGLTEEAFATMTDTFGFKMGQLRAQFDVLRIQVGEKLANAILFVITVVEDLVGGLSILMKVASDNRDVIAALVAALATFAAIRVGVMLAEMITFLIYAQRQWNLLAIAILAARGALLGPWGIAFALALVATGLIGLNRLLGDTSQEMDATESAAGRLAERLRKAAEEARLRGLDATVEAIHSLGGEFDRSTMLISEFEGSIRRIEGDLERTGLASLTWTKANQEARAEIERLAEMIEAERTTLGGLKAELDKANVDIFEFADAVEDGVISVEVANAIWPDWQQALKESADSAGAAADAQGDLESALKNITAEADAAAGSLDAYQDALRRLVVPTTEEEALLIATSAALNAEIAAIDLRVKTGAKLTDAEERELANLEARKDAIDAQVDLMGAVDDAHVKFVASQLKGLPTQAEQNRLFIEGARALFDQEDAAVKAAQSQKVLQQAVSDLRARGMEPLASFIESTLGPQLDSAAGRIATVGERATDTTGSLGDLDRTDVDIAVEDKEVRAAYVLIEQVRAAGGMPIVLNIAVGVALEQLRLLRRELFDFLSFAPQLRSGFAGIIEGFESRLEQMAAPGGPLVTLGPMLESLSPKLKEALNIPVDPLERDLWDLRQEIERLISESGDFGISMDGAGAATAGAGEDAAEATQQFTALEEIFGRLTDRTDTLTSALRGLLDLPTLESAWENVELARLRLALFDQEAAAERGKLAREKQIADLQDRLNRIQGKGNELLEEKLGQQIEEVGAGLSPAEREALALQDQIDAIEHQQERRRLVNELTLAQAAALDESLLTQEEINYLVGGLVAKIPQITSEQVTNIAAALEWLGVNQDISDLYARIYSQLKDISHLQAALGLPSALPTGPTESGWQYVNGQWVYTPPPTPLPSFRYGGTVPGPFGKATLVEAHGGERILPAPLPDGIGGLRYFQTTGAEGFLKGKCDLPAPTAFEKFLKHIAASLPLGPLGRFLAKETAFTADETRSAGFYSTAGFGGCTNINLPKSRGHRFWELGGWDKAIRHELTHEFFDFYRTTSDLYRLARLVLSNALWFPMPWSRDARFLKDLTKSDVQHVPNRLIDILPISAKLSQLPNYLQSYYSGFLSMAQGGVVPGPIGQPQPILAHGGEMVIPPGHVAFEMPISVSVQGLDWLAIRTNVHAEIDTALDRARTASFKSGTSLSSGVG